MLLDANTDNHPSDRSPMITSAYNADGQRVEISDAASGNDYTRPDHPGCVLRPVHSIKRQSHFRHKAQATECPEWTNESVEHEKIKTEWFNFLQQQLSGCFLCVLLDEGGSHNCPAKPQSIETVEPWYNTVLWVCGECSKPHTYDFLDAGDVACTEEWVLDRSCRPDITIFDSDVNPKVFIEFRKSSSGKSKEVADNLEIAWFEIDVLDGDNFRTELLNDRRSIWDYMPVIDEEMKETLRRFDKFKPGQTEFTPVFDDEGNLIDAFFAQNVDAKESLTRHLPKPHFGHYLFANRSNLGCGSQVPQDPQPAFAVTDWHTT